MKGSQAWLPFMVFSNKIQDENGDIRDFTIDSELTTSPLLQINSGSPVKPEFD